MFSWVAIRMQYQHTGSIIKIYVKYNGRFRGRHFEFHIVIKETTWWSMLHLHCDGDPWKHGSGTSNHMSIYCEPKVITTSSLEAAILYFTCMSMTFHDGLHGVDGGPLKYGHNISNHISICCGPEVITTSGFSAAMMIYIYDCTKNYKVVIHLGQWYLIMSKLAVKSCQ
jgi:hypothetical protein